MWYPYVEFKEAGNMVTLNPFRLQPVPETQSAQAISKLPANLRFDATHTMLALLSQMIGNQILVTHQSEQECSMIEILKALGPMPNAVIASQHSVKIAAVTFAYTIFSFASFTELTDFVAFLQSYKDSHKMQVVGDR